MPAVLLIVLLYSYSSYVELKVGLNLDEQETVMLGAQKQQNTGEVLACEFVPPHQYIFNQFSYSY